MTGLLEPIAENSTISRIWVEHTKVGMWFYVCSNLVVDGCRLRDTLADGINFCVDTRNWWCRIARPVTLATIVLPCGRRHPIKVSFNSHPCRGPTFFATARASCRSLQTVERSTAARTTVSRTACSRTSPPAAVSCSARLFRPRTRVGKIDNNFSGTTVVRNCDLIRCGGFDHDWAWRAAFQLCLDRRSISGVEISNVNIKDSLSDGFSIVAPGSKNGTGHTFQCPPRKREHPQLRNRSRLAARFVGPRRCLWQRDHYQFKNR